jgi:hypothetical protein
MEGGLLGDADMYTTYCLMLGRLENNNLERIWKDAEVVEVRYRSEVLWSI